MAYPALEKELKDRALLHSETKMWLRLGFYVSSEPRKIMKYGVEGDFVLMVDGAGNKLEISATIGRNIRTSILSWWQVESTKPRAQEPADDTGLSGLENRNGN